MANAAEMQGAAKAALDLADAMVRASQALVDNAHAQMSASPPTMTLDEYRSLVIHHAAVVGNAATIRQTTALDLGTDIQEDVDALTKATNTLKGETATLKKVQNVIDTAAKILVAAASLATLVASPSLMTVGAVISAVLAVTGKAKDNGGPG